MAESDHAIDLGRVRYRVAVDRARGLLSLLGFVRAAWPFHNPGVPLHVGWYLEALCEHLEALSRAEITGLAVALPPGFGKSLAAAVYWPVWHALTVSSEDNWIEGSCDVNLCLRDARNHRDLLDSVFFRDRWGDKMRVSRGENAPQAAGLFAWDARNDEGEPWRSAEASRYALTVGEKGKGVGWRGSMQLFDDPFQPVPTPSALKCAQVRDHVDSLSRAVDVNRVLRRAVVGHRTSQFDLHDYARESGWTCLTLPLEYNAQRYSLPLEDDRALRPTSIGEGGDHRTSEGELLCPEMVDEEGVKRRKQERGTDDLYAALDLQDPPEGQRILTLESFGASYKNLPSRGYGTWSWDLRFSERQSKHLSWVVGQYWWRDGSDVFLVEEKRQQWGFMDGAEQCKEGAKRRAGAVLIENKANGPAQVSLLRDVVPGLKLIEPVGSKIERAQAAGPFFQHVHLPDAPWIIDWLKEVKNFPRSPDDRVDAMTQFLCWTFLGAGAGKQGVDRYSGLRTR